MLDRTLVVWGFATVAGMWIYALTGRAVPWFVRREGGTAI